MKTLTLLIIICFAFNTNSQNYKITGVKGKFGLENNKGDRILKQKYDAIYPCVNSKDHVIAEKKYKTWLVNVNTKEILELDEYPEDLELGKDKCNLSEKHKIRYIKNGKTGLYQFPQTEILPAKYSEIKPLKNFFHACLVGKDKLYSFYYFDTKKFSEWFIVNDPSSTFYYDNNMSYIEDGQFFAVIIKDKWHLMNLAGETFSVEKYDKKVFDMSWNEPILTKQNGKYGYMDIDGTITIKCKYDDADWFDDDISVAKFEGKYGIINSSNEIVIPFIYDKLEMKTSFEYEATFQGKTVLLNDVGNPVNDLMPQIKNSKFGYTFEGGAEVLIDYKFDFADWFSWGIARVNIGGKYNSESEMVEGGKWGFIVGTGDILIECIYDNAESFLNGKAKVKKDGKEFFINTNGKCIENCP